MTRGCKPDLLRASLGRIELRAGNFANRGMGRPRPLMRALRTGHYRNCWSSLQIRLHEQNRENFFVTA